MGDYIMDKLKSRLDAFSDAVIAIIITIMVLELPMPEHDSIAEYLQFGKAIGIFFISFVFVANIWYQHSMLYNDAETITETIFIWEFIFMAFLCLVPIFTKMMTYDTNRHTVMAYGVLTTLVGLLLMVVTNMVLRQKYTDKKQERQVFRAIYGQHNNYQGAASIAALVLAYFQPEWAVFVYLALPVISFIFNRQDYADFEQVANLSATDKEEVLSLSTTALRKFRQQQRDISRKYISQRRDNPNWRQDLSDELSELVKANPQLAQQNRQAHANRQANQNRGNHHDHRSN